jgi:hypothetical protein
VKAPKKRAGAGVNKAKAISGDAERYAGFTKDLEAHIAKSAARRAASATPIPGSLRIAFTDDPAPVCGFNLYPVVAAHIIFLQKINSPLIEAMRLLLELADKPEAVRAEALKRAQGVKNTETASEAAARLRTETVETFFIFTKPPAHIRALLKQGRDIFRETAMREIVDKIAIAGLQDIQEAIGEHFANGFATAISYRAKKTAGDGSMTIGDDDGGDDGLGWWLNVVGTMVRDFHMPLNYVLDELPLNQAFAFLAWNTETAPWASADRTSDGYVAQEASLKTR